MTATITIPERELAKAVGDYYADPLGFVLFAYPWGKPGPLREHAGPDKWQAQFLKEVGEQVLRPLATRTPAPRIAAFCDLLSDCAKHHLSAKIATSACPALDPFTADHGTNLANDCVCLCSAGRLIGTGLVHRRKTRPLRRRCGYLVPEAGMFCTCCSNLILARYLERPLQENLVEWSRGQRVNC